MSEVVLVVEDELFVALDVASMVEEAGLQVDGPHASLTSALAAIQAQLPDCAILDVQLGRHEVYPAADYLQEAGVPIVFHSGHADEHALRARYATAEICPKPCSPALLRTVVQRVLSGDRSMRETID